ncbi:MAG: 4-hydroxy-tetrahydrodipicolinate synthase [Rhodothermales bacterium]
MIQDTYALSLRGCHTAIVTPFATDGTIDYPALDRLIDRQLEAHINGIVLLGTTGENPTITRTERTKLIEHTVGYVNGRALVIVGTGSNSTQEALELTQEAARLGADAALVAAPAYNKPTQTGLQAHFLHLAEHGGLPIVVYNVPGRSAVNIEPATVAALAAHPQIVAIKEASGALEQIHSIIEQVPSNFAVLSGDDAMTLPLIRAGGVGVVSVLSNLYPWRMNDLVHASLDGDTLTARAAHDRLLPMMHACFIQTNPLPIKTALAERGLIKEVFRLPLCPMDAPQRQELVASVQRFDTQSSDARPDQLARAA